MREEIHLMRVSRNESLLLYIDKLRHLFNDYLDSLFFIIIFQPCLCSIVVRFDSTHQRTDHLQRLLVGEVDVLLQILEVTVVLDLGA